MKLISSLSAFALTVVALSSIISFNQTQAQDTSCQNQVTGMTGTLGYDSLCISPALAIPPTYKGTAYERYMKAGMDAGANFSDFNSALINFQKASQQVPADSEAYREARRGYKAAWLAKEATERPTFDPYLIWLQVSGVHHEP
jgi:hypothetical protein